MKTNLKIVSILIILLSIIVSCTKEKRKYNRKPKLVRFQKIGTSNYLANTTYSGVAEENLVIDLSFRASGTLTQLDVEMGENIKKGDLIATIDNVSSKLAYEQAITQKNANQSIFNTAKSSLERARILYEKGSISLNDFEQAKNRFNTSKENLSSAKRGISIQKEQIDYGKIYAPEDGVISAIHAEVNENVTPGQAIITLNAGTTMEIKLGVPESIINTIKNEDKVSVVFPSLKNKLFTGIISEISPAVTNQSSIYPVRVALEGNTESIKNGMTASVTFQNLQNQRKAIIIPSQSVGEDYTGKFVFLIEKKDAFYVVKKQQVKIGTLNNKGFEIISGVKNGDHIATAGLNTLLNGQIIRLQ